MLIKNTILNRRKKKSSNQVKETENAESLYSQLHGLSLEKMAVLG